MVHTSFKSMLLIVLENAKKCMSFNSICFVRVFLYTYVRMLKYLIK